MELKEFDLNAVLNLANKQNQAKPAAVKPEQIKQKPAEEPTQKPEKTIKGNSFDLNQLLNKAKAQVSTGDSKTLEMLRNTLNGINANSIRKANYEQEKMFSDDETHNELIEIEIDLQDVENREGLQNILDRAKKFYTGRRKVLQTKYDNAAKAIERINQSPDMQRYNECKKEMDYYEKNRKEWKEEATNPKLKEILSVVSNNTAFSRVAELINNFDEYNNNFLDTLTSTPSEDDVNKLINSLPDTDDEDPNYNKEDFINNLSPETKHWFLTKDKFLNSGLNAVDKTIWYDIQQYFQAREFVEKDKKLKNPLDGIENNKIRRNNIRIENDDLKERFLDLEKLIDAKRKELGISDISPLILPRKQK